MTIFYPGNMNIFITNLVFTTGTDLNTHPWSVSPWCILDGSTFVKHILLAVASLFLGPALCLADESDGPSQGTQQLTLQKQWRAGGDDEDIIFGRITDLKLHSNGDLYILDNQLCHVVVISKDGEYLRTISRQGDGPGELRQPMGLVFIEDNVIGVGMGFPAKLITIGVDGTPIGTHYPVGAPSEGNVAVMISLQQVDGVLAASGGRIVATPGIEPYTDRFLSVGNTAIDEFHHILEKTTPFDPSGYLYTEASNYYIDGSWTLGSQGRIYAPMNRDVYEISEFDTTGKLVRVFGREYKPRKRTAAEKSRVAPTIDAGTPANTDWTIEDYDACVSRIMVNPDDDTIWVLTPHGHEDQPDGILESWDVFAPDGEYLRQVSIPLGHVMDEGTCFLVGNHRLVVVRGTGSAHHWDEDDGEIAIEPLEIFSYEIR
jgi:6-bladed beta-propeller